MRLVILALAVSLLFATEPALVPQLSPVDVADMLRLQREQSRRAAAWWEYQARALAAEKALGEINGLVEQKKQALKAKYNCASCELGDDGKLTGPPTVMLP